MPRLINWLGALALLVFVVACVERTETVTLNPDGSGKALVDVVFPQMNLGNETEPNEAALAMVKKIILSSDGADAWQGVSYQVQSDGRVRFKGTVYFSDLEKLNLVNIGKLNVAWTKVDDGRELRIDPVSTPDTEAPQITDRELEERVAEQMKQWEQQGPMMYSMMQTLKLDITYKLPGTVTEVNVLQPIPGGVRFLVTGEQVNKGTAKLMQESAVRAAIKAGREPGQGATDADVVEAVFGDKGPIMARVGGEMKPQFDYAAEVAAAKAQMPEMLKKLGISK